MTAILVPGYLAPAPLLAPMAHALARRGVDVRQARLPRWATGAVPAQADALAHEVARLGSDRPVDLVAVSQGALIALWWLLRTPGARARRLVTVGGPVGGTWFAALGAGLGAFGAGARDALPKSAVVAAIGAQAPAGVATTTIALRGDPIAPPSRCRLEGAHEVVLPRGPLPLPHQGLVVRADVFDAIAKALQDPA